MTFTAIGACPETGRLGIGITTYSLGVGGYCPFFERGVAVLSTQAFANPALGPLATAALRETPDPQRVLGVLAEQDAGFDWRQVVIAASDGRVAAHTGPHTRPWSGHITGEGFAVFGNVLAGRPLRRWRLRGARVPGTAFRSGCLRQSRRGATPAARLRRTARICRSARRR